MAAVGCAILIAAAALIHPGQRSAPPRSTASTSSASGWPSLKLPAGDGGVRLQFKQLTSAGATSPDSNKLVALGSATTGRQWTLHTDHLGRSQIALPAGTYIVWLGLANGPQYRLHVRPGEIITRHIVGHIG